ncbi:unnamed protein product [Effrenium voratum]|uniref:Microbial-type PARG catalytic domain-containing protein n=1 Tax=Effrenium voratum TaxID=2562239 RepID=A0AA36JCH2_9DINO|nr:unnamed protein product [Effrenium voratum]CAJ1403682.1 unnamed protein product [Effrenium voratum]CAJ1453578.1 unnamed protein product [Effrenium voratum]
MGASLCAPPDSPKHEFKDTSGLVYRPDAGVSATAFNGKGGHYTIGAKAASAPRPEPAVAAARAAPSGERTLPPPAQLPPQDTRPVDGIVDTGERRSRSDPIRKMRVEIAEMNYKMRNMWQVPACRYVAFNDIVKVNKSQVSPLVKVPKVTFSTWSTADALLNLGSQSGKVVCGLNFANGEQVGGGYKTGALAQEEDLCRRIPNLYTSLLNAKRDGLYPFGPCTCRTTDRPEKYSDLLFTSDLVVARKSEEKGFEVLPPEQQVHVSLITAAAPNVNFAREIYDLRLMRNTIRAVFLAPRVMRPDTNTLILGAWGCGAFGGNPHDISELFAAVLADEGLGTLYQEVHFAIPGGRYDTTNGKVFWETLRKKVDVQEISC